jgi:hypothetical protein
VVTKVLFRLRSPINSTGNFQSCLKDIIFSPILMVAGSREALSDADPNSATTEVDKAD